MSETIKGGAYQDADGTWRDANGKPLSSKQVQEFQELKAEQESEAPDVPEAVTTVTDEPPVTAPAAKRSRSKGG